MSVSVEKRRRVAELESFERRIAQEKRRLMGEMDSLEKRLFSFRMTSLPQDLYSEISWGFRAVNDAVIRASPLWFYLVGAIIVVGGAGLVTSLALRSDPSEKSERIAIQGEAQRVKPAPEGVAGPAKGVETPNVVTRDLETAAGSAMPGQPMEMVDANMPLPEPLPPPAAKPEVVAPPPLANPAAVSALDEARPKTSFDDAPPLDMAAASPPASVEPRAEPEPDREEGPVAARRQARCFVKVDGRVVFEHACPIRQPKRSTLMLDLGEKPLLLSMGHGRTWTATLGGRSLGKVYKSGQCWGRRRQVYICAYGA